MGVERRSNDSRVVVLTIGLSSGSCPIINISCFFKESTKILLYSPKLYFQLSWDLSHFCSADPRAGRRPALISKINGHFKLFVAKMFLQHSKQRTDTGQISEYIHGCAPLDQNPGGATDRTGQNGEVGGLGGGWGRVTATSHKLSL